MAGLGFSPFDADVGCGPHFPCSEGQLKMPVSRLASWLQYELVSDVLEMQRSVSHLTKDVFNSPHWSTLHRAMAEAILPTASKAGMEIIVWESAAMLLRDFYSVITQERQQMLMDVLKRAASQLAAVDKTRKSLGPPPHFQVSFMHSVL